MDCVSAIDPEARTIFIADAHRDNGKRFVVRADERLAAFVELESMISAVSPEIKTESVAIIFPIGRVPSGQENFSLVGDVNHRKIMR